MKEVAARSTHCKIAFFWCVINNGYHQLIIVSDRKRTCCSVAVHAVYLRLVPVCPLLIPLIISWCVILNSLPGYSRVAITAALECVWITAPAPGSDNMK